jgi:hypothetical protein
MKVLLLVSHKKGFYLKNIVPNIIPLSSTSILNSSYFCKCKLRIFGHLELMLMLLWSIFATKGG